jgi:hypothetical protein
MAFSLHLATADLAAGDAIENPTEFARNTGLGFACQVIFDVRTCSICAPK